MPRAPLALAVLLLCLTGCAASLRGGPEASASLSQADTALDGRLVRCSALGPKAHEDPDCESAFAEARRRILPAIREK